MLITLDHYDYKAMLYVQPYLGAILFWSYMMLGFFVLFNMFIAIIADAYQAVAKANPDSQDFDALADQVFMATQDSAHYLPRSGVGAG